MLDTESIHTMSIYTLITLKEKKMMDFLNLMIGQEGLDQLYSIYLDSSDHSNILLEIMYASIKVPKKEEHMIPTMNY